MDMFNDVKVKGVAQQMKSKISPLDCVEHSIYCGVYPVGAGS